MTATLLLWAALSYFVLDTHTGLAVAGWLLALHQWCWGMAANEMVSRAYLRRGWTLEESTPSPVVWEMVTPGVCLFLGLFFAVASV
jgi:hypothetical protein